MTDNFDEFEQGEAEHDLAPPPTPTGFRANLVGAWRSQPLFKLFVLMVVVGAVVAVAISLFSGNDSTSSALLGKPPDLQQAAGGKSTPYLKEQTELANNQRTKEAMQSGGSAIPTPIGPSTGEGEFNPGAQKEDPINELRAEVENMNKQLQEAKQIAATPPVQQAPEPFDDSLAQAMQKQMGQLLDSWAPKGTRVFAVTDIEKMNADQTANGSGSNGVGGTNANASNPNTPTTPPAKTIVPAGTVSYAELLTEANSDVPSPILGQLVSGPLKGARIVGQFQVVNGYADYLTLTFKLADLKGTDYKINALALDPDTTLGGMATEVDQRYMTRLVLPAAAGFLQGFASALGQGNSTITTNGTTTIFQQSGKSVTQGEYAGVSAAAQTAGQFFQNQANQTRPLVRVASGTPMGIFFIETVTDAPIQQQNNNNNAANQNQQAPAYVPSGQNPYGTVPTNYGAAVPNAYPVPYPNYAAPAGYGVNYGGAGGFGQSSYPGASVYYTH